MGAEACPECGVDALHQWGENSVRCWQCGQLSEREPDRSASLRSTGIRYTSVLLVAVLALLVATAPAAAATNTALGSKNTTESDFRAATTLHNVSVTGTGSGSSVALVPVIDSVEDGDVSEYTVRSGSLSVESTTVSTGDWAIKGNRSDGPVYAESQSGLENYPAAGNVFSADILADRPEAFTAIVFAVQGDQTNNYAVQIRPNDDEIHLLTNVTSSSGGTSLNSTAATINQDEWYTPVVDWGAGGNISATVYNSSGSAVGTVSAIDNTYSSGGIGLHINRGGLVSVTGFLDNVKLVEGSGTVASRGEYRSSTESVEAAVTGFTNLTLSNADAVVTWLADTNGDGTFETTAATSTFTSTGNHTLDISGTDSTDWRVNVTFIKNGSSPTAELHDEGLLFTNHAPEFNNSTAEPGGGSKITTSTINLNISLNDTDFGTNRGDSVDVEFFVNGSSVGTNSSITSNGTVSFEHTIGVGGDRSWHAVATDSYGGSNTSATFLFQAPANLTIRNVTNPTQIVTSATANLTFFSQDSDTIITRSTTNGNVSLSGLPIDEQIVVQISASGFQTRRTIIDSLFDQQNAYVLNTTVTAVAVSFELDDATGQFVGNDVQVLVERPINLTGTTDWERVEGDVIGADGEVPTILEQDQRYRIVVRSPTETRVLGSYVALSAADPETLPIGELTFGVETQGQTAFGANLREISGTRDIQLVYYDAQDVTSSLDLLVYNQSNASHELLNTTIADPTQRHVETVTIPASNPRNVTWVIEFNATRTDADDVDGVRYVGGIPELTAGWTIDTQVLGLMGWVGMFALAGWFGLRNQKLAPAGVVVVAFVFDQAGVFAIHPVLMGLAGAIGVLVLFAGDR